MKILIMGIGAYHNHGGFEACVENLAPFLAAKGMNVFVFRQITRHDEIIDVYKDVNLINIIVENTRALGSIIFDRKRFVT